MQGAMALYYRDMLDFLKRSGFDFNDEVLDLLHLHRASKPRCIERLPGRGPRYQVLAFARLLFLGEECRRRADNHAYQHELP